MFGTATYGTDVDEHKIEFEFDTSGVIVNRGRLYLDGHELGQRAVHWGASDLHGELPDGRPFKVEFGSGFVGQLTSVELVLGSERAPLQNLSFGVLRVGLAA